MKNKTIRLVSSLIIGLILVYIWLKFINLEETIGYLKKIDLFWVSLSIILYILAYFIRSIRWRIILAPIEQISVKQAFAIFMGGMLINYIIPIRAGEVAKSFFLKGMKRTPVSLSLPTVFIDKMMDLFPIVILLLLLPLVPVKMNSFLVWVLTILVIIFVIFVLVTILAVIKQKSVAKFLQAWFFWLPKKWKDKVYSFLEIFVEGLTVVKKNKQKGWEILGLTILAIIFDAVYIVTMFLAFDYQIAFLVALFGYTLINLSYILPTPPAQIGSNEAIYIIIFTFALGIDKNLVSASLGFAHLLTGSIIFIIGLISLNYIGVSLGRTLSAKLVNK